MLNFIKIFLLLTILCLISIKAEIENDDESVCKMENKKGLSKLKEKYKDYIQNWRNLQKRACKAKTDVKEANEGLEECIIKKIENSENSKLKATYLETFNKCMKKIAPIKDVCDEAEQKERIYCFVVDSRTKFMEFCKDYISDQVKQREIFNKAYECIDKRLKDKGV